MNPDDLRVYAFFGAVWLAAVVGVIIGARPLFEEARSLDHGAPTTPYVHHELNPDADPAFVECFSRLPVRQRLESIHSTLIDTWELPRGQPADQEVVLRFRLQESGHATALEILSSTNLEMSRSILSAVERSSPFPPLDQQTSCLATFEVTATFRNPLSDQ